MKTLFITLLTAASIMITANLSYSQVGIGTKTPDANSVLDVNSNTTTTTLTVDKDGKTRIGNVAAGNTTYIEADGSLSYEGTATRWDDLKVPLNTAKIKPLDIDPPEWATIVDGLAGWWFKESNSDQSSAFFNVQLPHAWSEGTDIYPHIHWMTKSDLNTTRVKWGFEYVWVNVGDILSLSGGTSNTLYVNTRIAPGGTELAGTAGQHLISAFGSISGSGKTLSSMLICRVFRVDKNDLDDDFNDTVMALEIDFHYQIDSDGSRDEYTK